MRPALILAPLFFLAACVGGDDTTGKPQGSLGGPCFANNTCNTGLVCALENGAGVCEQSDATVDQSSGDGTTDDAPSDAPGTDAGDSGVDAAEAGCGTVSQPCAADCHNQSLGCCIASSQCTTAAACTNSLGYWNCTQPSDCAPTNARCCVGIAAGTGCPAQGQLTSGALCVASGCAGNQMQICLVDQDCSNVPNTTCKPVSLPGVSALVGLCLP